MTEKIKLYQEVLELEPNSRVFLPLAHLYVKEKEFDKAIQILETGLARHKDFLEARLFLIELLYKTGQTDKCNQQVSSLSKIFASYAGFWEAWAACLAANPDDADTASVIRFLAAHFIAGPVYLHDVLNRGIKDLVSDIKSEKLEFRANDIAQVQPQVDLLEEVHAESEIEPELPDNEAEINFQQDHAKPDDETPEVEGKSEVYDVSAGSAFLPEENDMPPSTETPSVLPEEVSRDGEPVAEQAEAATDGSNVKSDLLEDMVDASNVPEAENESESELIVESSDNLTEENANPEGEQESGEVLDIEQDASADEFSDATPVASESEEDEEESFNLRTQSMADVLADQGDVAGALDILHELARNATGKELESITHKIEKLEPRQASIQEEKPAPDKSKEKLIGMLEALAQRVEARARN